MYRLVKWFFDIWYKFFPQELVQYWKTGDIARAKLVTLDDGSYAMLIEGEKYPLYGFPRGPVLFGPLARMKHIGKNLIFNQSWKMLEEGCTNEEVMMFVKNVAFPQVFKEIEEMRYDMFPPERLCPAVREIWRAMGVVGKDNQSIEYLKKAITFGLQEDDAYRFRIQWVAKYLNPSHWLRKVFYFGRKYSLKKELEFAFSFLEHAEITPDMKGRARLIKRIVMLFLEDKELGNLIEAIVKELDWKRLLLSKSDIYFFRGKYFKVDLERFSY